jgi:hypothetical protein
VKGLPLIVATLAALLTAGSAQAASPALVSVGQQDRHPHATFGSLPGVDYMTVYIATKPDLASDGGFLQENIKDLDFLTADEIASSRWLYEQQLVPGLYYVMARAFDFDCYQNPNCIEGFSNMLTLDVPKPAQRYRTSVQLLRFIGVGYLNLSVSPLGEKLPYRVCWTLTRGSRCLRSTVTGYSWNAPANDLLRVSLRRMRKLTTFTWYADGRIVSVKRVRIRR